MNSKSGFYFRRTVGGIVYSGKPVMLRDDIWDFFDLRIFDDKTDIRIRLVRNHHGEWEPHLLLSDDILRQPDHPVYLTPYVIWSRVCRDWLLSRLKYVERRTQAPASAIGPLGKEKAQ